MEEQTEATELTTAQAFVQVDLIAAMFAELNIGFKEPMTHLNCVDLLRGMALDCIKARDQIAALRAALKATL